MLETICEVLKDAYQRNWITSRDGNVSIRHHDRDHFYITPSGVRKQTLQPDQFKKIKIWRTINSGVGSAAFNYSWEDIQYTDISAKLRPSGEIPLHFCQYFPELSRYTKVAPNVGDVPPISEELGNQCHEKLQLDRDGNIKFDIVGIKGHGVVAIDTSPWRAYEHIERLEHICKIVLASGNY